MNIVFFANGKFALKALQAIYISKHNLSAVVTNIPKPAGRQKKLKSTPIATFTSNNNINTIYIDELQTKSFINDLKSLNPHIFIVISYKILPKVIYSIPKFGSINIHASYLPEYPGASPIQYSIINNEKYVGLTSFFINDNIDKGDIIKRIKVPIDNKINYGEAHDLLSNLSSSFILETIDSINNIKAVKQEGTIKKYAKKIVTDMYKISLDNSSENVHNFFRGLTPPGPYLLLDNKRIKLFDTFYTENSHGLTDTGMYTTISNKLYIRCKSGTITAKMIQFEGKNTIKINDFKNMNLDHNNKFE